VTQTTDRSTTFASLDSVRFSYPDSGSSSRDEGGVPFRLACDSLAIARGEHAAIIGPSGSGKTTLLNLLAGILVPDEGSVTVDGVRVDRLSDAQRRAFRIRDVGLVLQDFGLIDYLSAGENLLLPFRIHPAQRLDAESRERAREIAGSLGIAALLGRRIARLSQGERQRVAIGRALVTGPKLILADEPTGNLDPDNKHRVLDLLLDRAGALGATVIVVTHDHALLSRFDRVHRVDELTRREASEPRAAEGER